MNVNALFKTGILLHSNLLSRKFRNIPNQEKLIYSMQEQNNVQTRTQNIRKKIKRFRQRNAKSKTDKHRLKVETVAKVFGIIRNNDL